MSTSNPYTVSPPALVRKLAPSNAAPATMAYGFPDYIKALEAACTAPSIAADCVPKFLSPIAI
jgi:hypothetical protein